MPKTKIIVFLIFILTLSFYSYTLLPSLAWGDGTKLQSEVIAGESFVIAEMTPAEFSPDPFPFSRVGVAAWDHPFYIVLGHFLVKTLSFVDSLWLVNFVSAVFGAASVALVFLLSYRSTASLFASGYASLSLAVSHTFWWHSSTPEVYTLFVFLLLVGFYFFDRFEGTGTAADLMYSAFFLGLAASTHILAFLAIPALGLYYLLSGTYRNLRAFEWRKFAMAVVGFLAGFSLYLVQFIRISANLPFGEIMGPVVGSMFVSQLDTFSPILLGRSLLNYLFFLTVQFGPVGLMLGALGIRKVFADRDFSLRKVVAFFILFVLFGIFYRVTDQFTFFIASYIFWALLMGIGSDYALQWIPLNRRLLLPLTLAPLLLATPFFYAELPRLAGRLGVNDAAIGIPKIGIGTRDGLAYYIDPDKRGDFNAYHFGSQTLSNLPPGSIVLAEWYTDTDEYFILRYFTKIAKLRPDVTVLGWATENPFAFDSRLAVDVIEAAHPEQPIYLASLSDRFYASSKLIERYCIVPENNLYRLYQKQETNLQCLESNSVTE